MSAAHWIVTGGKYLLAKGVESAFEGNKDMLMRKTVKSDEGSPERRKSICQSAERFQGKGISLQQHGRYLKTVLWKNLQVHRAKCVYWCFIIHQLASGHDNFTTSWKIDNRCLLHEMFMMSGPIDLPEAMRLTAWSQPISAQGCFSITSAFTYCRSFHVFRSVLIFSTTDRLRLIMLHSAWSLRFSVIF